MAQPQSSAKMLSGALTVVGLGLVWVAVATNWPTQEELTAVDVSVATVNAAARPPAALPPPPALDLRIPTSPPLPADAPSSVAPESNRSSAVQPAGLEREPVVAPTPDTPAMAPLNGNAQQVARLKCEAEIEQLCPDSAGRGQCLQHRAQQLPPLCQQHVRERFVKWKEDRSRSNAACEADTKRFCSMVRPGGGQIIQCLQEHAQDVSDRCYQTLPKGKLLFRQ